MSDPALQAYYDKTLDHLVAQGEQALTETGRCAYRTQTGLTCAVGCHIPSTHPASDPAEPGNLSDLLGKYPDLVGVACVDSERGIYQAEAFQSLHDHHLGWGISSEVFDLGARKIAEDFGLNFRPRPGMHGYVEADA